MSRPVITALTSCVPPAMPLSRWLEKESALRTTSNPGWNTWMRSWHPDYAHWLEASPQIEAGHPPTLSHDPAIPDRCYMIPVETTLDQTGLAARVLRNICARRPGNASPIDVIMFCHTTPGERVPATTAGRLCEETGASCLAFSVSQQQGASVLTALRLAGDLLLAEADVHTILIVAAEKWYPPFTRCATGGVIHGDAAGALLIQRAAPESGGLRILDAETRRVPHRSQPGITESDESWASTLTKLIDLLLARNGLRRNQINDVIGHQGMPSLSIAVHSHLGRPAVRERRKESAHLGAAESIVRLAQTPDCLAPRHDRRTLLWGFGIGGFIGAALLEARGMPFQDRRSTRRSAS